MDPVRFGRWTVLGGEVPKRTYATKTVLCRCDCGTEKMVHISNLRSGMSRGCGCRRTKDRSTPVSAASRVGHRFDRLVILSVHPDPGGAQAVCRCDCGNETVGRVTNIVSGGKRSCGCLAAARRRAHITHGMSRTNEYRIWASMVRRCCSSAHPAYDAYGGRGIRVCDRWRKDFAAFFADMGPRPSKRHSIDRIDNDGNYEPGNCRWATQKQQCQNTRRNVWLEYDGLRMTASDWAKRCGVSRQRIEQRIAAGMPIEKIVAPKQTQEPKRVRAFGKDLTISEWSKLTGLSYMCIMQRLRSEPPEQALDPKLRHHRSGSRKPKRCGNCGQLGHNRKTCSGKAEAA